MLQGKHKFIVVCNLKRTLGWVPVSAHKDLYSAWKRMWDENRSWKNSFEHDIIMPEGIINYGHITINDCYTWREWNKCQEEMEKLNV